MVVVTQCWPAHLTSVDVGPCLARRFQSSRRLDAVSLSFHPVLWAVAVPPLLTMPSNRVMAVLSGLPGMGGAYAECSRFNGIRCAAHVPIASVSIAQVGCSLICTRMRAPARVSARPVSHPLRSRRVKLITLGSGCSSAVSTPHCTLNWASTAMSCKGSLRLFQPSPQSMNMNGFCIMPAFCRSRGGSS